MKEEKLGYRFRDELLRDKHINNLTAGNIFYHNNKNDCTAYFFTSTFTSEDYPK